MHTTIYSTRLDSLQLHYESTMGWHWQCNRQRLPSLGDANLRTSTAQPSPSRGNGYGLAIQVPGAKLRSLLTCHNPHLKGGGLKLPPVIKNGVGCGLVVVVTVVAVWFNTIDCIFIDHSIHCQLSTIVFPLRSDISKFDILVTAMEMDITCKLGLGRQLEVLCYMSQSTSQRGCQFISRLSKTMDVGDGDSLLLVQYNCPTLNYAHC